MEGIQNYGFEMDDVHRRSVHEDSNNNSLGQTSNVGSRDHYRTTELENITVHEMNRRLYQNGATSHHITTMPEANTLTHKGRPTCHISKHKSQCHSAPGSKRRKKQHTNTQTTVILTEPLINNNSILTLESVIPLPPLKAHELAVLAMPVRYQRMDSAGTSTSLDGRTVHHQDESAKRLPNSNWFTPRIIILFITLGILVISLVVIVPTVWVLVVNKNRGSSSTHHPALVSTVSPEFAETTHA